MASIHRKTNSPYWHCAFYLPDGRRTLRSTGTSNKRKALSVCLEFDKAARAAEKGRFTEARARKAIADIYAIANNEDFPSETVNDYLSGWLMMKSLEVAENTLPEYQRAVDELKLHLGAKAAKPMDAVTVRDIVSLRGKLSKRVAGATVNKTLKILQSAWAQALKDGLVQENTFKRVDPVKVKKAERRPFTMDELGTLLDACNEEWRGMVLFGLYTGQRLSDIASLTWRNVDLESNTVKFTTRKTDRPMAIPIAKPLNDYVMARPSADDPDAQLFPDAHRTLMVRGGTGTLSRQFSEILIDAGLITRSKSHKTPKGKKKGRNARRAASALSFHCLRHTATSLLKNAGVSDVVAREIIGHESEAVSRIYTHIEPETLRQAVEKMPDLTSK